MDEKKRADAAAALGPFFPPQIAQDNFQRIMAPIPGASKFEAVTLAIYCAKIEGSYRSLKCYDFGLITRDAIKEARHLIECMAAEIELIKKNQEGEGSLTVIH